MRAYHGIHRLAVAAATTVALASFVAVPARVLGDTITVKGDTIRGTVKGITSSEISFETEYGKGSIAIPLKDVEAIQCDSEFVLVHGIDEISTRGKILAIRDGSLVVGENEATAVSVPAADLFEVYDSAAVDGATGWIRAATALWHGSFDVGFGASQSTTDTAVVGAGFTADRKKAPSRIMFNASYRYGTQKKKGEEKSTTENEIFGLLRGEYDVVPRLYWFASDDAEYDEIESLSIRTVPKTGFGYRLWESKSGLFQLETGGAYVYEKFFGGDDNGYFAIAFGKLLEWDLPWLGSELTWRTDYLPAVDDWAGDYLVRSDAALLVPMVKWLKFRVGVSETYDSTPADDTNKNSLETTVGLAATY